MDCRTEIAQEGTGAWGLVQVLVPVPEQGLVLVQVLALALIVADNYPSLSRRTFLQARLALNFAIVQGGFEGFEQGLVQV